MNTAFNTKASALFLSFILLEATVASIAFYEITQSKSANAVVSTSASKATQNAQQRWDGYAPYAFYQTLDNLYINAAIK